MQGNPSGNGEKLLAVPLSKRGEAIERDGSARRDIPRHLYSAADFVLSTSYDMVSLDHENVDKDSGEIKTEAYAEFVDKKFNTYVGARTVVYRLICLEERIKSSSPDWDCDNLSDADLKSFMERQLRKEHGGLPEEIIVRRLKCRVYNKTNDIEEAEEICSICRGNYEEEEKIGRLEYCVHEFHASCIKSWLVRKNCCPTCRNLGLLPEGYLDWVSDDMGMLRSFFKRDLVPLPSYISNHGIDDVDYIVAPTMSKLGLY